MRKPMKAGLLLAMICVLLVAPSVLSQNNANIWYFGEYAGIDFNSGTPVALTNSAMDQHEGCATVSDNNGNLLFYTDGMRIWNANHSIMPNGLGLMGHPSSAQSGIIVPKPGNPDIYYVFTVPSEIGSTGLRYSEVDMAMQGGLGDVTAVKNIFLVSPTEEKVTAVRHANNIDVWVVTHTWNSNDFHAFLVNASGVSLSAVVSSIGAVHSGVEGMTHSCMKFSPDGTRLGIIVRQDDTFEVFDFDNSTGVISNPVKFAQSYYGGYGIEFSSDGSLVYISRYGGSTEIWQFEVPYVGIATMGTRVGTVNNTHVGTLQLAPDGRIYVAKFSNPVADPYLGRIEFPNIPGVACNYVDDAFFLQGGKSNFGLPTFIQSYLNIAISADDVCEGDLVHFFLNYSGTVDSVRWDFGDPLSGANNTSTIENPSHLYTSSGIFNYNVIVYSPTIFDTIYKAVEVSPIPVVDLGHDTTICPGSDIILSPGNQFTSYTWQDGSSEPTLTAITPGEYWVEVEDNKGCPGADTILISLFDTPTLNIGNDTTICGEISILLDAGNEFDQYIWQDGSTAQQYWANSPGYYWVLANKNGCEKNDTVYIAEDCPSTIWFPNCFTPNGDGINERFFPVYQNIGSYQLLVFNRWGQMLYESNDIDAGWDGTYKGENCNGVFFFICNYIANNNSIAKELKGSVTVLR